MPKVGVEPTLLYRNYALNVARLPIPPLRHVRAIVHGFKALSTVHGSSQNFYAVRNISYLDTSFSKGKITPCFTHPTIKLIQVESYSQ